MTLEERVNKLEADSKTLNERLEKINTCHIPSGPRGGEFCSGGGGGTTGSKNNKLSEMANSRHAYERKAANAVKDHPNLNNFIDTSRSVAYSSPTSIWQQTYTGPNRETALKRVGELRAKAEKLGYARSKTSSAMKHADGSSVDIILRKTSLSPGGKVGSGVQVTFKVPRKK